MSVVEERRTKGRTDGKEGERGKREGREEGGE